MVTTAVAVALTRIAVVPVDVIPASVPSPLRVRDFTIVTAPYSLDQEVVGVLGVIGPTRMAYERVIPIVDITAKLLGSALNSRA